MPNLEQILRLIESKKKTSFPWEREAPHDQAYYSYSASAQTWQPVWPAASSGGGSALTSFRVLSWNIDFMLPYPDERMQAALDHVHGLVGGGDGGGEPSIIFFNEMLESDLALIQEQPWIQQAYNLTDIDSRSWESGHYGTCTLVPKSLAISRVFRVHYAATRMERDALFVDVLADRSSSSSSSSSVVRLCNTHLESLVAQPPLRPEQVKTASSYLRGRGGDDGDRVDIVGGVMAGDFNAIQPFDRALHADNGLRDAYLELGGEEDAADGSAYTWGQMAPVKQRDMFGCSRMDKIFFWGDHVQVVDFRRFGYGVEVGDAKIRNVLMDDEGMDDGWVTDHLGVMARFKLTTSTQGEKL